MRTTPTLFAITLAIAAAAPTRAADPWADAVVQYMPGADIGSDFVTGDPYTNDLAVLGEPTRFTSDAANFGGATSPFSGAFRANEVVSVGLGGSLTVSFDEPVENDPLNPFGVDLLIFGNSFFFDDDYPNGVPGTFTNEGGVVEVSANGIDFFVVPGIDAEGFFPTLGYSDLASPYSSTAGAVPTDFTKPVDPTIDLNSLTFPQMVAAYDGSGGGVGVDLSLVGLDEISYVRISNPTDAAFIPEIDALADVRAVPEPAAALLLLATLAFTTRRHVQPRRA